MDKNKELIDLAIILHKQSGSVEPFGKASTGDIDRAYADAQEIIDEGFSRRPELDRAAIAFMIQETISETYSRDEGSDMIDLVDKYTAKFTAPKAKQREVKWPEKMKCHEKEKCGRGYPPCSSCGWNEAIDACMDKYLGDSK